MRILISCALLVCSTASVADSYMQWGDQIEKASKGINICYEHHSNSISGDVPANKKKALQGVAKKNCAILKSKFNSTMLAARANIDGMDSTLANFHKTGLEVFDQAVPGKDEAPFSYYLRQEKQETGLASALLLLREVGAK